MKPIVAISTMLASAAFESAALAAPPLISSGEESKIGVEQIVSDAFEVSGLYQTEEEVMEATGAKQKRKGRLGRLTWEFDSADTLNQNRRVYPTRVFRAAVEALAVRVAKNVVFGNVDHPCQFDPDSMVIKLHDVGVKVVEAKMLDDKRMRVTCDILDNPHGQQLSSVLAADGNPGVSQRAVALFHEATETEIVQYAIPEGMYAVVADVLRIATYDVVSEAGFKDAHGAVVTENKGSPTMTRDELKAKFPDLYNAIHSEAVNEGKTLGLKDLETQVAAAVEQRKPQIVADAIKPVTEKLTAAEGENTELRTTLAAIKPVMEKLGLVNEKITDKDAAAMVATSQAKQVALEAELAASKDREKAATEANLSLKRAQEMRDAMEAVSKAYEKHPAHDKILTMTRDAMKKHSLSADKAMETAKGIVDLIHDLNPAVKAAAEAAMNGTTVAAAATGDVYDLAMDGLLKQTTQANTAAGGFSPRGAATGAGGKAPVGAEATEANQQGAAMGILLAGMPPMQ